MLIDPNTRLGWSEIALRNYAQGDRLEDFFCDATEEQRQQALEALGFSIDSERAWNIGQDELTQWGRDANHWEVAVRYNAKRINLPFHQGSAHTGKPGLVTVVYCLVMDSYAETDSFEEWLNEYGFEVPEIYGDSTREERYEADRIKRMYSSLKKQNKRWSALVGDDAEMIAALVNGF